LGDHPNEGGSARVTLHFSPKKSAIRNFLHFAPKKIWTFREQCPTMFLVNATPRRKAPTMNTPTNTTPAADSTTYILSRSMRPTRPDCKLMYHVAFTTGTKFTRINAWSDAQPDAVSVEVKEVELARELWTRLTEDGYHRNREEERLQHPDRN
jgi:hypothetical protein